MAFKSDSSLEVVLLGSEDLAVPAQGNVAVAYHSFARYRFIEGNDAVVGKLIVGWLGAWLGSSVLGHWFWKVENVYVVPAILGAIATVHLTVLTGKSLAKIASVRPGVTEEKEERRPSRPAVAA
jgi:uncharacterized membrane protein YeaQ/YmgE (transglycosylase-associated protein family)